MTGNKWIRLLLLGAFGICASGSRALAVGTIPTLDLQQTIAFALTHNAAIAAKQAALAQAVAVYTKQHAAEFPPIVATAQNELARQNNFAGNFAQFGITPVNNFSQNTLQLGTQWTAYNGSLNQILTQQDRRQVDSARADLRQTQTQTTQNLVKMFFAISDLQHALDLTQANLLYQEALLQAAQAKERAGLVAGVDVLRADVAVQQAQVAILNAGSDRESAQESLAQTIGATLDTQFAAPRALPQPALPAQTVETLVRVAQDNRPDVAAAAANVDVARLQRSTIDTDLLPQVSVNAAFGNQTSPTGYVDQQNAIDQQNASCALFPNSATCVGFPFAGVARRTPGFWSIGAVSSISLPIIDYGTRHAAHRSADAAIESAMLTLASTRTAAQEDVLQSLRSAQTAQAALFYRRRAVALAVESARIAQLQYRNGLISLTDTASAQQTSLQAQSDLFSAQIAYINAVVKLRSAIGTFDPLAMVADL